MKAAWSVPAGDDASLAVNGDSMDPTETGFDNNPFWAVDLDDAVEIAAVLFTPEDNSMLS